MINYPTLTQAIILWQESLSGIIDVCSQSKQIEYIHHTVGVAESAYKIAQKCNLDAEKAYVLGLLHDYGKIQNEKQTGIAHFIIGYDKMMKSELADIKNITTQPARLTAVAFLNKFIEKDTKWAHIDITGMKSDKNGLSSGFGVKLLNEVMKGL